MTTLLHPCAELHQEIFDRLLHLLGFHFGKVKMNSRLSFRALRCARTLLQQRESQLQPAVTVQLTISMLGGDGDALRHCRTDTDEP